MDSTDSEEKNKFLSSIYIKNEVFASEEREFLMG